MSSHRIIIQNPKRRSFWRWPLVLAAAVLVTGCGFEPLYGSSDPKDRVLLQSVEIEHMKDRVGQRMRTLLRYKFRQRSGAINPKWSLAISIKESLRGVAVQRDSTVTRRELGVTASFKLRELGVKNPRFYNGDAISVNSFNELQSEFATLSAENDARDRALQVLSEELRVRVISVLKNPRLLRVDRKK